MSLWAAVSGSLPFLGTGPARLRLISPVPPLLSLETALSPRAPRPGPDPGPRMTQPEAWSPAAPLPPPPPQHLSLSGGSSQGVIIANTRVAVPGPASEGRQLCPLVPRASLPVRGHSSPLTGKPLLGTQKTLGPSCNVLCIF